MQRWLSVLWLKVFGGQLTDQLEIFNVIRDWLCKILLLSNAVPFLLP